MKNIERKIESIVKNKDFLVTLFADATYSSYWALVHISDNTDDAIRELSKENNECREEQWADVLLGGGLLEIEDFEAEETHEISLDDVVKGFKILVIDYPKHYANIMSEEADFYDYDAWLQCVVFGEVIYG